MEAEVEAVVRSRATGAGVLMAAGSVLVACSSGPDDRASYLAALTQVPAEALESCAAIQDASLAAECLTGVAARQAVKNVAAGRETCARVADAMWRDECYFLVTDAAEQVGRPALETCALAGRFAERCTQHAAHRDLESRTRHLAVGQEDLLWAETRDVVASYHPDKPAQTLDMMVMAAMAQELAPRWADKPFDVADCGLASDLVCAMAYDAILFEAREEGLLTVACAGEHTPEAIVAAGVTAWVGDEALPLRVFEEACDREAQGMGSSKGTGKSKGPGPKGARSKGSKHPL